MVKQGCQLDRVQRQANDRGHAAPPPGCEADFGDPVGGNEPNRRQTTHILLVGECRTRPAQMFGDQSIETLRLLAARANQPGDAREPDRFIAKRCEQFLPGQARRFAGRKIGDRFTSAAQRGSR